MPRKCASWFDSYLQYVENTEPPALYHKWVAISTIASVIGRKANITLTSGGITYFPNFYVGLVGPAGKARKGTAMGYGKEFLLKLPVHLAPSTGTREAFIRQLASVTTTEVDELTGVVTFFSSITVHSGELVVFLNGGDEKFISELTDLFDNPPVFEYDTISRGKTTILNPWLNLIGGITPELIRTALPQNAVGSGFTSRFMFVYQRGKEKVIPFPTLVPELEPALLADLEKIATLRGPFTPTDKFLAVYEAWYFDAHKNPPFPNYVFLAPYEERRATHLIKLSLIFAASDRDDMLVTEKELIRAIQLLHETERYMPAVFEGYGSNRLAGPMREIMQYIEAKQQVSYNDLVTIFFHQVSEEDLRKILGALIRIKFIIPDPTKPANTGWLKNITLAPPESISGDGG